MINFKSFREAVISKELESSSFSQEKVWKQLVDSDLKGVRIVTDKLDGYKLYQTNLKGDTKYFLSNDNNDYLGVFEYRDEERGVIRIAYTHSTLKGGFYNTILKGIFQDGVKEIRSDVDLSPFAVKAYSKLKGYKLSVLTDDGEYIPFNKRNLVKDEMNRVSIKK